MDTSAATQVAQATLLDALEGESDARITGFAGDRSLFPVLGLPLILES